VICAFLLFLQTTRRRGLLGLQREPRTYKRYEVGKDDQVRVWKMWEEATAFDHDLRTYQNSLSAFQAATAGEPALLAALNHSLLMSACVCHLETLGCLAA
jgi:hypothetical protein